MEQLQVGHVSIFILALIRHLQKLWIYPLAAIPQTVHKHRLIYDFSWSWLNNFTRVAAHKDSMRFGKDLNRLLD